MTTEGRQLKGLNRAKFETGNFFSEGVDLQTSLKWKRRACPSPTREHRGAKTSGTYKWTPQPPITRFGTRRTKARPGAQHRAPIGQVHSSPGGSFACQSHCSVMAFAHPRSTDATHGVPGSPGPSFSPCFLNCRRSFPLTLCMEPRAGIREGRQWRGVSPLPPSWELSFQL